ncbi:MAG: hypothetical protein ABI925_12745 [Verrucomicrobiota bacterium]
MPAKKSKKAQMKVRDLKTKKNPKGGGHHGSPHPHGGPNPIQ